MRTHFTAAVLLFCFVQLCTGEMKINSEDVSVEVTTLREPEPESTVTVDPLPTTLNPNTTDAPTTTTKIPETTTPTKATTTTAPSTTSAKPTEKPTTTPSSTTTPAPSPTPAPAPKPTPAPLIPGRKFDGASFIGGIILSSGLTAIGFVAFKFYKARTERNYHTLNLSDDIKMDDGL